MNQITNSSGNGKNGQPLRPLSEITRSETASDPAGVKESLVTFQTAEGLELRGAPVRVTRHTAVFELYNPNSVLRSSEVLSEFKIILQGRSIYSGRAVIHNFVEGGSTVTCEAKLDELHWRDVDFDAVLKHDGQIARDYDEFINEWQKSYKVCPEYKLILADMRSYFADLQLWVDQLELGIRSMPSGDRLKLEQDMTVELGKVVIPTVTTLFEKFEAAAEGVEKEFLPVHEVFAKRQLHPLLLCAPFLYRCYCKPLGYAGDYEMVNMMMRNPCEGGSLYAKVVNLWFLRQPPAEAHRNRIQYLIQNITEAAARAAQGGRTARILSLGCGPAHEVQRFLKESPLAGSVQFSLLDFNAETLEHTRTALKTVKGDAYQAAPVRLIKKSVNQILKESGRNLERSPDDQYDLVYCAGLFDYLTDPVCHRLTNILYEWVAPRGLLITTNVDVSNPRRLTMDYIMDWHLVYRSGAELSTLRPEKASPDLCSVRSDSTGVNIYFETQKPNGV